jgi:hypothetical protein
MNVHEVGRKPVIIKTTRFFARFIVKPHDTIPFTGTCKEVTSGGGEVQTILCGSMKRSTMRMYFLKRIKKIRLWNGGN